MPIQRFCRDMKLSCVWNLQRIRNTDPFFAWSGFQSPTTDRMSCVVPLKTSSSRDSSCRPIHLLSFLNSLNEKRVLFPFLFFVDWKRHETTETGQTPWRALPSFHNHLV